MRRRNGSWRRPSRGDYKAKEDLAGLYCEHGGEAELVKWYRESGSDAELRERGLPAGW